MKGDPRLTDAEIDELVEFWENSASNYLETYNLRHTEGEKTVSAIRQLRADLAARELRVTEAAVDAAINAYWRCDGNTAKALRAVLEAALPHLIAPGAQPVAKPATDDKRLAAIVACKNAAESSYVPPAIAKAFQAISNYFESIAP